MKKVLIAVLSLSVAFMLAMSADAKSKKHIKASPCVQKCKIENYKCRKVAKKGPAKNRNKKFAQCKNNRKACITKCKAEERKKSANIETSEEY